MEGSPKKANRWLLLAGIGFAITIIILAILGLALGANYRKTISGLVEEPKINEITSTEAKKVKKIIFQKRNSSGCIEVTPEGIVRVYQVCQEELESANRLVDPKNLIKLFKLVTEKTYKSQSFSDNDEVYQVILETNTGKEIFYIVVGGSDQGDELLDTLEDVIEDIPDPTPTSYISSPSPRNSPAVSGSTSPSGSSLFFSSPSPSPSGYVETFTCEFSESGGTAKPKNVSNVICTGDPSPAP
jgi:hypothetical protein